MKPFEVQNEKSPRRWGFCYYDELTSKDAIELTDSAFRLWVVLHTYAPKDRWKGWQTSAETLAKDCGFSRSTIFRALAELRESDLLSLRKKTGRSNRYILVPPKNPNIGTDEDFWGPANGTGDTTEGSSTDTSDGSSADTLTDHNRPITNPPYSPPPGDEKLNKLFRGWLDELLSKLESQSPDEQVSFFYYEYGIGIESFPDWNFRTHFKSMCIATTGQDPICYAIAEAVLPLLPPEDGRKRTAAKRRAFLTDCHEAIRQYGETM